MRATRGFILFYLVIIAGAFSLLIALATSTGSVAPLRFERSLDTRAQARESVRACIEKALQDIADGTNSGTGAIANGGVSCSYQINPISAGEYVLQATSEEAPRANASVSASTASGILVLGDWAWE